MYKTFNTGNNITCTLNCNYRIAATLHTSETWLVSNIKVSIIIIIIIIIIITTTTTIIINWYEHIPKSVETSQGGKVTILRKLTEPSPTTNQTL